MSLEVPHKEYTTVIQMCMYVFDGLTACPVNCESCLNSDTCTRCISGHYLLHGQCHSICPEEFEPSEQSMECIPKRECTPSVQVRVSQWEKGKILLILSSPSRLLFQCIVRWESGVSGGRAHGEGKRALEKKVAHGKFCRPPVLRATPALPP